MQHCVKYEFGVLRKEDCLIGHLYKDFRVAKELHYYDRIDYASLLKNIL